MQLIKYHLARIATPKKEKEHDHEEGECELFQLSDDFCAQQPDFAEKYEHKKFGEECHEKP